MDLEEKMREELNLPLRFISRALSHGFLKSFQIRIPKKTGGHRIAYHPIVELKLIQYWLIKNFFKKIKIHNTASAYVKGQGIRGNAERHLDGKFFLKLDFKDFFQSIKFDDLYSVLEECIAPYGYKMSERNINFFKKSCFTDKESLPVGYCTSPILSNAAMYNFDAFLIERLTEKKEDFKGVNYSRYADDMFFSCTKKEQPQKILKLIEEVIENKKYIPKNLNLNKEKTKFYNKGRGTAFVTGLRVCHDNHLTLHKSYKDQIRLFFSRKRKGLEVNITDIKLQGHLNFIQETDPTFFFYLKKKYFNEIRDLRKVIES